MENKMNLLEVLRTLFKWKKPILIISIAAGLGTAAISLLLPNYYKSTTVFFAASQDQAKPEVLFNSGAQFKSEYYGNENDIDRLLTIAGSNELADFLIDTFNLYEHYKINPEQAKASYRIRKKFKSYYDVIKTERDALELSFESKDPELAAKVANGAREEMAKIARHLIKESQVQTLQAYYQNIEAKNRQLIVVSDSMTKLQRRYGIYNVLAQTEALTTQIATTEAGLVRSRSRLLALEKTRGIPSDTIRYLKANVQGLEAELDSLEARMTRLRTGIPAFTTIEQQFKDGNESLSEDRERTKILEATFKSEVPTIILVEKAEVPIMKSRPRRSILVIAAGVIAFLFSVIGILLFDTYKEINWREIIHAK